MKFDGVVNPMIYKVKNICSKHNVEFAISFTTNGVFLSERVRRTLKNATPNVAVQIPFDGDSTLHDCVKKFPNGKGSYQIIKRNARAAVLEKFSCDYTM